MFGTVVVDGVSRDTTRASLLLLAPWLSRSLERCDCDASRPEGLAGCDDELGAVDRFAPNMMLPRLENSNCSKRSSSAKRLSVGMSVVIGIKSMSAGTRDEMETRDDDPRTESADCGDGSPAPAVVGDKTCDLGELDDLSEPHFEGLKALFVGDTSWASERVLFCSFFTGNDDRVSLEFVRNMLVLGSDPVALPVAAALSDTNVVVSRVKATGLARRGEGDGDEGSWARAGGRVLSGATLKTSSSLEMKEGAMCFSTNRW